MLLVPPRMTRLCLLVTTLLISPRAHAQYVSPRPHPTDVIEEVRVTARRRSEKVQDVPISITVLTGRQLQREGITQVQSLQFIAPSVNISLPNPRQTNFAIRGIGNNPATDGLSSSVGIYIDDVYLDRPGMADFNLLDIDQIEILRGPQGTLFGKNTTAGAISILTHPPEFTFGGEAQIEEGSRGNQLYRVALTGPVSDTLAFRVTAYDTSHSPYVKNTAGGQDVLGLDRRGVRVQLLYRPVSDFSLRLSAEYSEESDSQGAFLLYNPGPATSAKKGFVPYNVWAQRYGLPPGTSEADALTSTINSLQHMYQREAALSAEAKWDFGPATLTSITAYRGWLFSPNNDFDWTAAPSITTNGVRDNDKQASEEIRIASTNHGPVDYVGGVYAFWRRLDAESDILYGPDYSQGLQTPASTVFNDVHSLTAADPTTQSYAAFGQATWHATSKLSMTLGIRETYESNDEDIRRTSFPGTAGIIPASLVDYSGAASIDNWNYAALGSLSYHLTKQSMVYASVSRGAKAGGFNSPAVPQSATGAILPSSSLLVVPEKATDFELGVKNSLFDHRLILNADAFWTHVDDYQANTLIASPSGIYSGILNVGAVRSAGFEVEGTIRPIQDLAIIFSGSYDDAIYDSFRNAPAVEGAVAPTQDLTGRPVVGASRWTASVTGSYAHPITDRLEAYAVVQYGYKSDFFGSIDDSKYGRLPAAGITNFRVGATLDGGRLDVAFWARNAFDTRYFYTTVNAISGAGGYFANPGDPATYGISISSKF